MRPQIIFLSLVIGSIVFSCEADNYDKMIINEFPKVENINGRPITNIEIYSKRNVNLVSIDSFLVIQKGDDPFLRIYENTSFKLLAEVGKKGRGPNEFVFPELLNQTSFDTGNNSPVVCIYDYTRRRFYKLNILYAINNQSDKVFTEIPIPNYDQYFTYFFYRDDNLLIASPENNSRFVIYEDITQNYILVPYLPTTEFQIYDNIKSVVYRSTSFINKELGLIVSAPILLGELDYFDFKGNHLSSSIFFPRKALNKDLKNVGANGEGFDPRFHIVQLHANNKHIYALNYNNYQSSLLTSKNLQNQSILVFDWNGNPIKKYILDNNYFIKSFAVDWINNRFYGYCSDESENSIIMYEFMN